MPIVKLAMLAGPLLTAMLATAAGPIFEPAGTCSLCHRIAPANQYPLWKGSMKANAGVDPYWLVRMNAEMAMNPAAAAAIEAKCKSCHVPSGAAKEGVTCTVCHQIEKHSAGVFGFNERSEIFGPHAEPFAMPMRHHTPYVPVEGRHTLESSLCGSCHTVVTPVLNAQGKETGKFVEQSPYLEWLASGNPEAGVTCQSCHVPAIKGREYIAHRPPGGPFPPTEPRSPVGQHFFVGGNYLVSAAMGLKDTSERARRFVETAGTLRLAQHRSGKRLLVDVTLTNLTGHKLPTGFPSRRVWLHVRVTDRSGKVVFESGGGSPAPGQPHRDVIRGSDEVMVYEADMVDAERRPTVALLRAVAYGKDNRVLPSGFDVSRLKEPGFTASAIAPAGVEGDEDFRPGSDTVHYEVPAAEGGKILVEALYENVKPGHAMGIDVSAPPAVIAREEAPISK